MTIKSLFNIRRVSSRDKTLFTQSLSATVGAGLPILKAVTLVSQETTNSYLKEIGQTVQESLERGEKLSTALAKFTDVFDEVYIASIAAAEASGRMDEILQDLADRQENEYKIESALRSAVAYPIFVLFSMIIVTLFLMAIVVPKVKEIIQESQLAVPASTKFLLNSSVFVAHYWYIILIAILGLILWLKIFSKTDFGKMFVSRLVLSAPIIRTMYINVYMTRFTKTSLTLSTAGVPLLKSLGLIAKVINNQVISRVLNKAYEDVSRGLPMSVPLSQSYAFPQLVSQMIAVGEQTGKLDDVYQSLADLYEQESEKNISMITSLLEPILLLIVGIGVGLIVFSIVIPIYQATNLI
jgi:type II secretory pathway component PulF